tara:strand:- start:1074 stop:1307 length:234 start_codon:yes stop_codon:yes gene_type:complete
MNAESIKRAHQKRMGLRPKQRSGCPESQMVLEEQDVIVARTAYGEGKLTIRELADAYCVVYSTMRDAVKRRTWKHIP